MPISLWFAAAFAVAPALVAWWTGRALLARADDPMLPELLFERRRRLMGVALGGVLALSFLFGEQIVWALPLLWIALALSSYPLRRALFGERWSVFAFLRYTIFSTIGRIGLWLLAAAAPALAVSLAFGLAPDDPAAALRIAAWSGVVIAALLAIWLLQYTRVFLDLHRAVPLREVAPPELVARLDAVLDRAGPTLKRRPAMYRYGASGAYVMNAFAIPSPWHPAVALGTTLLATLSDDEVVAVFAHEVAHHEQFQSTRWRRARWTWVALLPLIALLPVLLVSVLPATAAAISWCMPLVILLTLGNRVAKRRDAETASDLRAVELTGNADALASALTKMHIYSRVPRRWRHAVETAATHPSLARRIQALRSNAVAEVTPRTTSVFTGLRSTIAGHAFGFDLERAYWFDGVPADTALELHALRDAAASYRAVAYGELAELRVAVADGARMLQATDLDGRRWGVPIAADDVALVQRLLDRVDVRLGRRRTSAVPVNPTATRWLALALFVMLAGAGQLGFAIVPLLVVLVRPALSAAVIAAAGIAVARVLTATRGIMYVDPFRQIALLLALIVASLLAMQTLKRVWRESHRGNGRRLARESTLVAGVLVGAAAIALAALWPALGDNSSALIGNPVAIGVAGTLAGIGGALLAGPSVWWRVAGSITSMVAMVTTLLLSGDGWLFNRLPTVRWTSRSLALAGRVRIPGTAMAVTASPEGRAFAVSQYGTPRRGDIGPTRYLIGRFDDSARVLRASDAAKILFLDEETLIALGARSADTLELRVERVRPNNEGKVVVLWTTRFATLDDPQLFLDRNQRRWIVAAHGAGDWTFVTLSDTIQGTAPKIVELGGKSPADVGERMAHPLIAFPDGGVLWTAFANVRGSAENVTSLMLLASMTPRWELRATDAAGERMLMQTNGFPTCGAEVDRGGALCATRSGDATQLWRAFSTHTVERIGQLPPNYDVLHFEGAERLALAERMSGAIAVLDVATLQGTRLTLPDSGRGRWTADAAVAGPYVFALSMVRDGATLSRFTVR